LQKVSLLEILNPDAAALSEAVACLIDAAKKSRIVFELIIEPILLGGNADQHTGWLPLRVMTISSPSAHAESVGLRWITGLR